MLSNWIDLLIKGSVVNSYFWIFVTVLNWMIDIDMTGIQVDAMIIATISLCTYTRVQSLDIDKSNTILDGISC